jgi:hypothetical protein
MIFCCHKNKSLKMGKTVIYTNKEGNQVELPAVSLMSKDGTLVDVPRDVVKAEHASKLIREMIIDVDDDEDDDPIIPLPEVATEYLLLVKEFLLHHHDDPMQPIPRPLPEYDMTKVASPWDVEFLNKMPDGYELAMAWCQFSKVANYVDMPDLFDLVCAKLACVTMLQDEEQFRKDFHLTKVLTPEEERRIREDNPWLFEPVKSG